MAAPVRPVKMFVIPRTRSIGTRVLPAVTRMFITGYSIAEPPRGCLFFRQGLKDADPAPRQATRRRWRDGAEAARAVDSSAAPEDNRPGHRVPWVCCAASDAPRPRLRDSRRGSWIRLR